MKEVNSGKLNAPTSTNYGVTPIPDQDLEEIAGGGISGQKEAARLLNEHLASLDALFLMPGLTMLQKKTMKASYEALFAKRLSEAVIFSPSP